MKNILYNLDFFKCLNEAQIDELLSYVDLLDCNEEEVLFYEHEIKQKFFYLLQGELRFYRIDRFDNEIFLYRLEHDCMVTDFVDIHTLKLKPCFANCVFTKKSQILSIEYEYFVHILKHNTNLYKNLILESSKRIERLEKIINRDIVYDGTAKVACMIDKDYERFNVLKKHEIAYELHMQPETLSRILAKMARNSLIKIQKNKITILNKKALQDIYRS